MIRKLQVSVVITLHPCKYFYRSSEPRASLRSGKMIPPMEATPSDPDKKDQSERPETSDPVPIPTDEAANPKDKEGPTPTAFSQKELEAYLTHVETPYEIKKNTSKKKCRDYLTMLKEYTNSMLAAYKRCTLLKGDFSGKILLWPSGRV